MRPNIVSEASLSTRFGQWWGGVPFVTSGLVIVCGIIYLVCLLFGYDSYDEICFWPTVVISRFQVYRIYTSVLFHGSVLHVMFNMLALVPIGSGLERIMGSIRYLHVTLLLATSNAVLHLLIAYLTAHNPLHSYPYFMKECTIGFSGIIFAMIVMETSLNGNQSRSVFGLFNVPGKWYAWILLVLFQLLMPHVSLIGHLCGILSGFSYTYGLFNHFLLGSSSYSAIESSALLAFCLRRPGFIVSGGSGAAGTGLLPSFSSTNASGAGLGNVWRNLHSWMPWRENSPDESLQDHRFPGRGRALGSSQSQSAPGFHSDSDMQARLLERNNQPEANSEMIPISTRGTVTSHARPAQTDDLQQSGPIFTDQDHVQEHDESIQNLVSMGFERSNAEVALAAANGDLALAVEFLSNQG
uniref:Rhomboid protein Ginbi_RBL15 n=1 Tax=Ginkgo biloba TaxID=3311 RepID=A0A0A7E6T9_GINBI|nr:rhomboid protein Ginbi_RBL15 [Ginkgo biloba]